jgi:hypothetical protein
MTSLGTDFEMHGYAGEHLRCVKVVTHLFGDGDLDADHCMVSPPTAKEFVTRKTRTIASGKAQGTEAVTEQATINLYSQVWKSLEDSFPKLYCMDLAEAYVIQESASSRILCEKERYDTRSLNGHSHQKPSAKVGNGKENRY